MFIFLMVIYSTYSWPAKTPEPEENTFHNVTLNIKNMFSNKCKVGIYPVTEASSNNLVISNLARIGFLDSISSWTQRTLQAAKNYFFDIPSRIKSLFIRKSKATTDPAVIAASTNSLFASSTLVRFVWMNLVSFIIAVLGFFLKIFLDQMGFGDAQTTGESIGYLWLVFDFSIAMVQYLAGQTYLNAPMSTWLATISPDFMG